MKVYIGIDNGVTGSIGIIYEDKQPEFFLTPVFTEQSYTKEKKNISRLNRKEFKLILLGAWIGGNEYNQISHNIKIFIEKPLIHPGKLQATVSAMRCLEATLSVIEDLNFPYQYIDSKPWQKELLPNGCKGPGELKPASLTIGSRLFPHLKEDILKRGDADGILIAEYARRKDL